MATLIRYCDGLMEANWLPTLLAVPLFFSVWGDSLQCEKSYLFRSLTILIAACWTVRVVLQLGSGHSRTKPPQVSLKPLIKTPLVLPVACLALALLLASASSLDPMESLLGGASRRDGSLNQLCGVLFFAALAASIRSDEQVGKLVTVAILTSMPICLYGIGQGLSIEPAISGGSDTFRVGSTLGNPVFLAAYLIMILPLTITRLLQWASALWPRSDRRCGTIMQTITYGGLSGLQVLTIAFTVSRGPTLGLLAGGAILSFLLASYFGKPWLTGAALASIVVLVVSLWLLASPTSLFHDISNLPGLQRFTEMLTPRSGSSGRTAIWDMAARASRFSATLEGADGRDDRLARLRFLIGYGPENARLLSRAYRSRDYNLLMDDAVFLDRFHNDFWEKLLALGTLGLTASLALNLLALYCGCQWLGLFHSSRHQLALGAHFLGGGIFGSVALVFWQGAGFLGAGFSLGTILGFMAFLMWSSWHRKVRPGARAVPVGRALLIIALISGLCAHLTDINFSFPTDTT